LKKNSSSPHSNSINEKHKALFLYIDIAARLKAYGNLELSRNICSDIINLCLGSTIIEFYFRGMARLLLDQFDAAIDSLTSAIAIYESKTKSEITNLEFIDFQNAPILIHSQAYGSRALARLNKAATAERSTTVQLYNDALMDCGRAISIQPTNVDALNNKGLLYVTLKELKLAFLEFNTSLMIDPTCARTYKLRGLAYVKDTKVTHAMRDFMKALVLDPLDKETIELVDQHTVKPKNSHTNEHKSHCLPEQKDSLFF